MAGNQKSSAGTSPIQVTVDVGLEGGASVRGGSGKLIREALDAVMAEISQKDYGIKINPIIDTKELQEKINSQLKKGIKVDVGANVEIKDIKNSSKTSSSDKAVLKNVDKSDADKSKPKASATKGTDPEYEKAIQKSVKSAKGSIDKDISSKVKESLKEAKNSVTGFDKAGTDEKANKINSLIKIANNLINNLTKLSNMNGSNDTSGLDEKYNNADFLTDRNSRVNFPEYLTPLKEAITAFNEKMTGVIGQRNSDSSWGAQDDSMNDIVLALQGLTDTLNQNYKVNINPDKYIGMVGSPAAADTSASSKSETDTTIDGKTINALAAALSKTKQQAISKATETAISNIDKNTKQIADALSNGGKASQSSTKKKTDLSDSVNISQDSINSLAKAINSGAETGTKGNAASKDYTEILERIANSISAKASEGDNGSSDMSQSAELANQVTELLKNVDLKTLFGDIRPSLSEGFESNLIDQVAGAIYDAMLQATSEGGGIKEAITTAFSAIPNSSISNESINAIAEAMKGLNIPASNVYVPAPIVNITQTDYTDTLNRIAENTTPKEDNSSAILNEIPDKVASGVTEAFKGIGVTQVNSGDDVKGVGRGLLSPEKALESLLNDKVGLIREKYDEKKRQLDSGMTEGERATSNRRIKELDSQITGINNKVRKYQNEESYSALFARAEELNKRTQAEFEAAKSFAKTQSNVYKDLQANEEKLYESSRQMIDNAVNGKKVGNKGFETLQDRSSELREQVRKDNLANDSLNSELESKTKSHIDSLMEYFVSQYKAVTEQIYNTKSDIGKAEVDKKGTKQSTEKLKSLETKRNNLSGIAGQLGIDSEELQAQLKEIDNLYDSNYKEDVKKYKIEKEAATAAKKEKEIASKREQYYTSLKEEIKKQGELYESLYKLYSLGKAGKETSDILAQINDSTLKADSIKSEIKNNGYSNSSLDKEISSLEAKVEKDRKALGKNYLEKIIKERIGLQKQVDSVTLKNMQIDSSSEDYAKNEIKKQNLNDRISFIEDNIISPFKSDGSYDDIISNYKDSLAQLGKEFDSQKTHIEAQTNAYNQLRAAVEALVNAQAELDATSITGDTIQISEKKNAVDTAKANIEAQTKYIRDNNLTNKNLETEINNYGRDKQFERLNNATKEYFNAKAELAKMGSTEAGKQSAEYKELEDRIRRLAEVETEAYNDLNKDSTRNDSRFKQWSRERNVLQSTVALEKNRAKALQDINNWEVKNRRAAEEYREEIDSIVEGLKDASDATSVDNLKTSFGGIKAEATSRGLAGRDETKQELEANMATAKSLQQRYQDLLRKADVKAFKEYQQQIDSTKAAIEEAMGSGTKDSLKEARRQLSELTSDFKSAGYAGGNMFTALDKKVRGLFQLFMSGSVIGQIKQQFNDAYNSVMNLDNAFATIRMTMEASNAEMKQLADESISLSKELGVSLESVTSAASIYANQNISTAEIIERSKPTALLASAAEMSSSAAADLIQGALYQFDMEDSVENLNRIVDSVEKISASTGVEFRRSIEQISEGIQTTGAMAHEAGFSIEQYAALVGGLVEKTRRSGSEVANGVKMIFARLGQNKEGDATEEEISKAEKAYKSIGISLRDGADNFRELPEVFDELSAKWSTLTDVQRAYIAEISSGNRNRSLFTAMMDNYDTVKSLADDAVNAEGFAEEANEERMNSFEAKLGKVKASAEGFWNNFINTDIIKGALDLGTGVIDFLDNAINKLPVISQLSRTLLALLAARTFPNFVRELSESDSTMGTIARTIKSIIPNFKEFKQTVENFKNINANSSIEDIAKAFDGVGSDETKTALARYVGITDEQIEEVRNRLRETAEEISNEADDNRSDESNPISDAMDRGREVAEQTGEAFENITQNLQEANSDVADSTQEAAQNIAQQAQAVDGITTANQQEAVTSAENVVAQQAQTAARTADATATATQISAENASTAATAENTIVENANTGATNANTAANATNGASQLTLLGGIKAVTKGLLAQAAAWAATPVGIITIAVTAVAGLVNVVNSINDSIDESREKIKETQKEASEAVEKYRSDTDDLKSSEDRVVSLSNKYRKLSKGVSENGYRVSLTREEYEEYKEVVNEIAKENDQLIKGYNLEGLALLDLGDTIDDTRKKYEELRKEQAKTFVEENTDKILAANKGVYDDGNFMSADDNIVGIRNIMNDLASVYNAEDVNSAYISFEKKYSNGIYEVYESLMNSIAKRMGYANRRELETRLQEGTFSVDKLNGLISEYSSTISNARQGVNQLISTKLFLRDEYADLSTAQKTFVDDILTLLSEDNNFYYKLYNEEITIDETVAAIISKATDSDFGDILNSKKDIEKQYEIGKLTFGEYKDKVNELRDEAAKILGDSTISTAVAGLFDTSDEESRRKIALKEIKENQEVIAEMLDSVKYARYMSNKMLAESPNPIPYSVDASGNIYSPKEDASNTAKKIIDSIFESVSTDDLEIIARLDINPEWSEEDLRDEIRYEKIRMRNIAMSEFNFLDSAYKSDIETFTSTISKLESALKSVDTMSAEDLLELMMQFSDFDWKSFGVTGEVGVGNVSGALRQLIDKALSDLIDTFGDVNSSQIKVFTDMADNAKKAAEKIDDVSDAMNGLKSAYDNLKSVQEDIAKYGRISIDTVADIIDEYPELADEGAAYVSGKISVDEFMKEYKKSYDKVFKEKQQYIYKKALENPDVRKDYEAYISAKRSSEIDAETQALISSEANRIRTRAEAEAKAIYTGLSKTYGDYYDSQTNTANLDKIPEYGLPRQEADSIIADIEEKTQKAKDILDNANAEIELLPAGIEKKKQENLFALWGKMKDEYNVDLGAYSTYAEAKEHIDARIEESLSDLADKYSEFYDEQNQKLDTEAMSQKGYSGQEIAYAMTVMEKARQKRTEVQELTKDIENYYKSSCIFTSEFVDKVSYLYDVDVKSCKSYAEAKAKIYKQLLKMNMKLISFMGDDVKQIEILKDLINEDTGEFDAGKAITKYKVGQDVVIELKAASDTYKEILKTVGALGEIDLDNIDPSFFEDINLEGVEEEAEKLNELLSEMISLYDRVFDGIQAVADKRIETLEKEKEALEDKNEEENREIELIKARQQLEDAKNNKNVRVYYEGKGFVWEADKTAIAEAEENLKDKELEAKTAAIDKEIDALTEYKDQFANISSNIEDEKNISAAMRQLGVNAPEELLKISDETVKSLENNYRNLSLSNDKQENLDKIAQYTPMTDEQIREKFGSNFGIPLDSLRNYWNGTYFIPDTIKQYMDTEKKTMQALTNNQTTSPASENKTYYIENINITYAGDSFDELMQSATRLAKVTPV